VWQAAPVEQTAEGSAVVLSYTSVDGEEVGVMITKTLQSNLTRWRDRMQPSIVQSG
jgi:hypothetical protein